MARRKQAEAPELCIYEDADNVDCASIDSFPASDPPGWVCTSAQATPETVQEAAKRKKPARRRH